MIRWRGVTIDRDKRTIANNGRRLQFATQKRAVRFDFAAALLLAGPLSKEALFDLVFDGREDGGPLYGKHVIDVMLCQLRPKFSAIGIKITADLPPWFSGRRYWAKPIKRVELMEAAE